MTHHMNEFLNKKPVNGLRLILAATVAFGLAACGDGGSSNSASGSADSASSDSASQSAASNLPKVPIVYTAEQVVDGVALGELSMGSPDAPVTMIEYASLTCPHCALFHNTTLPQIKERYIETGQVRLVFRNYIMNQYDLFASMVSRCAGPERAFGLMELFYNRQNQWLSDNIVDNLADLARRAGMNRATFDRCLQNTALQENLIALQAQAVSEHNVNVTPTFLINGERIEGAEPFENFAEVIDDEL